MTGGAALETEPVGAPPAERAAAAAFVGALAVAAVVWVVLGRRGWFAADEWSFLAGRRGTSLHDLFAPHNEHWSTLPIVEFRILFRVVGLRSYVPYLLPVVAAHLALAGLLRWIARRAGVHPWIATAGAALFAFFGSGWNDIVVAFQTGFCGALAATLLQVVLADHDGEDRRRDGAALLVGLVGLLCSGVGVIGVLAGAATAWWRRGPRAALAHGGPLTAVYVVWLVTFGDEGYQRTAGVGAALWWAARQLGATLWALGWVPGVGVLLGLALVVGTGVAVRREGRTDRLAAPVCLALAAIAFALATGRGRATGPEFAGQGPSASRYLHVTAALLLPLLLVGLDQVRRHARVPVALAVVLLLVGVPGNLGRAWSDSEAHMQVSADYRKRIPELAQLPAGRQVPPGTRVGLAYVDPSVTFGWLHSARKAGELPPLERVDRPAVAAATAALVFTSIPEPPPTGCRPFGPSVRTLHRGEVLRLPGPTELRFLPDDVRFRGITTFGSDAGGGWRLRVAEVRLRAGTGAEVCPAR